MKKIITSISLLIVSVSFSQSIDVNPSDSPESSFTIEQLTTDILAGSCSTVNNISSSTGIAENAGQTGPSFGYFVNGGGAFPIGKGVILSTGRAIDAVGPNDLPDTTGGSGAGTWNGDTDMQQILDVRYGDTFTTGNATVLEFDFVPVGNNISFDYVFASEEWNTGSYECPGSTVQDGFAFIISGPGILQDTFDHDNNPATPETPFAHGGKNIALIPGTNQPVSVGTIYNNPDCTPSTSFENLHVNNTGVAAANSAVEFNAMTVILTAQSNVTPGATYHLKLVIADRGDEAFDSAVFLAANSFDAAVSLGNDITMCEGANNILTANGTFSGSQSYAWQLDGSTISGANSNTLDIDSPGTYLVTVTDGDCTATDSLVVSLASSAVVTTIADMILTDTDIDGFMPFDLSSNDALIAGGSAGINSSYHLSMAEATSNSGALVSPYTNISNPQTIYVRIEDTINGCIIYSSFNLIVIIETDCFDVNAGVDQNIDCSTDSCVDLTVTFTETKGTSSYDVSSLDPVSPFPYTGLANPISVGTDDVWSDPAISIPFNFSFFENDYTELIVGSNGVVTFDSQSGTHINGDGVSDFNDFCEFGIGATGTQIPAPTFPYDPATFDATIQNPILNAIYGIYHDIDPSLGGEIGWELIGTAPCRTMVISFNLVPLFDCETEFSTFQMVLWESTNIIDVYVQNKSACSTWNDGLGVIGIQNNDGTLGYSPAGRNTGDWSATNEAWRFSPDGIGTTSTNITWYNGSTIVGTGATINVCPSVTTNYVAEVTYFNTDGTTTIINDVVTVIVDPAVPTVDLGEDMSLCNATDYTISSQTSGSGLTFEWQLAAVTIAGETNDSLLVNASGNYTLIVTDDTGCSSQDEINISLIDTVTADLGSDFDICQGTTQVLTVTTNAGAGATYVWSQNGVVMVGETNNNILINTAGVYSVVITVGTCVGNASVTVSESTSMTMNLGPDVSICEGSTVILMVTSNIASAGIAYTWYLDGVIITGVTLDSINVTEAGAYSVNGVSGSCNASGTIDVEFISASFTVTIPDAEICLGQPYVLDATPVGNTGTASYVWNTGEATSTITISTIGVYTVTITADGCEVIKVVNVTEKLDCIIPSGFSPNNDGINDSFDIAWLEALNVKMYNRYGTKVYEKANYRNEWYGVSDSGYELPTGTYYYVIEISDGSLIKGWVYINREN
ncbi:MAG: hypothetical protein COA88_11885 [Kordia sp.]|nr:MAG: hypothetical protein COA88_11885 [Kordia sp.]